MPIADWTLEKKPGEPWTAGEPTLTAGAALFDALPVYAGQLGKESEWTIEDQ